VIAALLDWIVKCFVGILARDAVKEIKPIIDDEISHHIAMNDADQLKKAETDKEKADALQKIASDTFGNGKL
jgi:hypothetical protein